MIYQVNTNGPPVIFEYEHGLVHRDDLESFDISSLNNCVVVISCEEKWISIPYAILAHFVDKIRTEKFKL